MDEYLLGRLYCILYKNHCNQTIDENDEQVLRHCDTSLKNIKKTISSFEQRLGVADSTSIKLKVPKTIDSVIEFHSEEAKQFVGRLFGNRYSERGEWMSESKLAEMGWGRYIMMISGESAKTVPRPRAPEVTPFKPLQDNATHEQEIIQALKGNRIKLPRMGTAVKSPSAAKLEQKNLPAGGAGTVLLMNQVVDSMRNTINDQIDVIEQTLNYKDGTLLTTFTQVGVVLAVEKIAELTNAFMSDPRIICSPVSAHIIIEVHEQFQLIHSILSMEKAAAKQANEFENEDQRMGYIAYEMAKSFIEVTTKNGSDATDEQATEKEDATSLGVKRGRSKSPIRGKNEPEQKKGKTVNEVQKEHNSRIRDMIESMVTNAPSLVRVVHYMIAYCVTDEGEKPDFNALKKSEKILTFILFIVGSVGSAVVGGYFAWQAIKLGYDISAEIIETRRKTEEYNKMRSNWEQFLEEGRKLTGTKLSGKQKGSFEELEIIVEEVKNIKLQIYRSAEGLKQHYNGILDKLEKTLDRLQKKEITLSSAEKSVNQLAIKMQENTDHAQALADYIDKVGPLIKFNAWHSYETFVNLQSFQSIPEGGTVQDENGKWHATSKLNARVNRASMKVLAAIVRVNGGSAPTDEEIDHVTSLELPKGDDQIADFRNSLTMFKKQDGEALAKFKETNPSGFNELLESMTREVVLDTITMDGKQSTILLKNDSLTEELSAADAEQLAQKWHSSQPPPREGAMDPQSQLFRSCRGTHHHLVNTIGTALTQMSNKENPMATQPFALLEVNYAKLMEEETKEEITSLNDQINNLRDTVTKEREHLTQVIDRSNELLNKPAIRVMDKIFRVNCSNISATIPPTEEAAKLLYAGNRGFNQEIVHNYSSFNMFIAAGDNLIRSPLNIIRRHIQKIGGTAGGFLFGIAGFAYSHQMLAIANQISVLFQVKFAGGQERLLAEMWSTCGDGWMMGITMLLFLGYARVSGSLLSRVMGTVGSALGAFASGCASFLFKSWAAASTAVKWFTGIFVVPLSAFNVIVGKMFSWIGTGLKALTEYTSFKFNGIEFSILDLISSGLSIVLVLSVTYYIWLPAGLYGAGTLMVGSVASWLISDAAKVLVDLFMTTNTAEQLKKYVNDPQNKDIVLHYSHKKNYEEAKRYIIETYESAPTSGNTGQRARDLIYLMKELKDNSVNWPWLLNFGTGLVKSSYQIVIHLCSLMLFIAERFGHIFETLFDPNDHVLYQHGHYAQIMERFTNLRVFRHMASVASKDFQQILMAANDQDYAHRLRQEFGWQPGDKRIDQMIKAKRNATSAVRGFLLSAVLRLSLGYFIIPYILTPAVRLKVPLLSNEQAHEQLFNSELTQYPNGPDELGTGQAVDFTTVQRRFDVIEERSKEMGIVYTTASAAKGFQTPFINTQNFAVSLFESVGIPTGQEWVQTTDQ